MKAKELVELGIPSKLASTVGMFIRDQIRTEGKTKREAHDFLKAIALDPDSYNLEVAEMIKAERNLVPPPFVPNEAPFRIWGEPDEGSKTQLENACKLPISVRGALMPDAHLGYGLPIGGVLATDNAVIPFAVGVDIACRMRMTVYAESEEKLNDSDRLEKVIEQETRFGVGSKFDNPRNHAVMDEDWNGTSITRGMKDRAWSQLGSSGSGNHFCEFGVFTAEQNDKLNLKPGKYLALLSHSGSRGAGAKVAGFYSKLAESLHPELPDELKKLSWFDLDSEPGQEYWYAMNLMGRYAAANHECIHKHITKRLGFDIVKTIENHHNFAWKEQHGGKEVIVHRKGATPAGQGVLGIIPGSMGDPGFVVSGKGNLSSLESASHGAGRRMSRTKAKEQFTWHDTKKYLLDRGVKLISAGLDECPMAYKDINEVMSQQEDLVEVLGRFDPRLVKMAPEGERARV